MQQKCANTPYSILYRKCIMVTKLSSYLIVRFAGNRRKQPIIFMPCYTVDHMTNWCGSHDPLTWITWPIGMDHVTQWGYNSVVQGQLYRLVHSVRNIQIVVAWTNDLKYVNWANYNVITIWQHATINITVTSTWDMLPGKLKLCTCFQDNRTSVGYLQGMCV